MWQCCQTYAPAAFSPQGRQLATISVRGWVDHRDILRLEGLSTWNILKTPSRIEHATFRLLALPQPSALPRTIPTAVAAILRQTWITTGHLYFARNSLREDEVKNLVHATPDLVTCKSSTHTNTYVRELKPPICMIGRSQWSRGLRQGPTTARLLGLRVRMPSEAWRFVSFECCVCQVEVSATGRLLIQRSPTECVVWSINLTSEAALARVGMLR